MASAFNETPVGRVAIVTGGSRGVGRETASRLADCGYAVVVNYAHDQRAAESAVEAVLARRGAAVAIRADVGDDLDVERLFAEAIETFGGIDALVHAAPGRPRAITVAGTGPDEVDALWRMTGRATLMVNREAARRLRGGGAIVNLVDSVAGSDLPSYGVYAAMTAAVATLTGALASELRERDITVNTVALGAGPLGAPREVADVIAYLLSSGGHLITGQVIRIGDRG